MNIRPWFESWLGQLRLRRAPQDDPWSVTALAGALLFYVLMDLLQALAGSPWSVASAMTFVDSVLLVVFSGAVLTLTGKPARYIQTLTALAGTGAMLGIPGLPLVMLAARAHQSGDPMAVLVLGWLVLLVWNITVQAHIYRHALSAPFGVGLMVSGLHTVLAIILMETLFPRAAG